LNKKIPERRDIPYHYQKNKQPAGSTEHDASLRSFDEKKIKSKMIC